MTRILIFLITLITSSINAQPEVKLESTVEAATIFLSGASLTRTALFTAPAGSSLIILEKLPMDLEFNSVKLSMGSNVSIKNISQRINHLERMDVSEETLALSEKRDSIDLLLKYLALDLSLVKEKISLIKSNTDLDSESDRNVKQAVTEYLLLYDGQLADLKKNELELNLEIQKLNDERSTHLRALNEKRSYKEEPTMEIVVEVDTKQAVSDTMKLEYYTPNAAWFPKYTVRVDEKMDNLDLGLRALVVQSTPEEWKDVSITLSNVQPDIEGSLPELEKWELTYKRLTKVRPAFSNLSVRKVSGIVMDEGGLPLIGVTISIPGTSLGTITDLDGSYEIAVSEEDKTLRFNYVGFTTVTQPIDGSQMNVVLNEGAVLDEVVVTGYGIGANDSEEQISYSKKEKKVVKFATVEERVNAVEYEIISKQTISNEGKSKLIDVQQYELDATFEHHTVPKLKEDVYIQAVVADWDEFYFLNGEMNIYLENSYVGKSLLETNVYSDTLFLSLGKDYNVAVERKPIKSTSRTQFLGPNKIVSKSFQINVKNLKRQPLNLFVHDQIPVSIINSVDVELVDSGEAKLDQQSGELLWQKQIPAKSNDTFSFTYKVKFPKGEEVILE